jgi:hypothetical protein
MSEENIEVVRLANAAFNSGDDKIFVGIFAPGAELRDLANAPDQANVLRGRDAIQAARDLWTAAFDEFRADIEKYTEVGNVRNHDVVETVERPPADTKPPVVRRGALLALLHTGYTEIEGSSVHRVIQT